MGTEMGVFPPSWWYTFRGCGRFKEMAASLCFLGAGCGVLLCLARAQQLLRQAQEHLGHPRSVLPTCAYSHRAIKVGGGQLTRVTGFRPQRQENLCPLPVWFLQYVLLRITWSKQSSTAASFTDSTGRYLTTSTYSGAENAANSASRCYIKAEQGYQNMEREKQKQHRQGVRVHAHGCKVYFHSGMATRTTEQKWCCRIGKIHPKLWKTILQ